MIGQSQVTEPLMTALRTNRVNHAYLFSGPRGCGKTTSARILARCLNCAEGPTDTPCGVCPSCIELSRDGSGSLDVVEIDAASHNGVDDARDIRERAIFAPARDRYKIFILDEAHMVTPQGFNALLKIVEEPPEHVKFIFATTEPEKVIGTIRSRTHHYPFRLVPPAQMLEYAQSLCESEGIQVAPGVLPLVVRAGGGSPRDTLSLLDQLIAGSDGHSVSYDRAVALLGYTHGALLDDAIDAIAARDSSAAFDAVDRVIQTGQDPRRFVEDLLERMRDLIIVAAAGAEGAAAVLRGVPRDEIDHMNTQSSKFGPAELSRTADILNAALTEMTGATSPRLHLELMIARALIPASDDSTRGALARVERLERRVGVDGVAATPVAAEVETSAHTVAVDTAAARSAAAPVKSATDAAAPVAATPVARTAEPIPTGSIRDVSGDTGAIRDVSGDMNRGESGTASGTAPGTPARPAPIGPVTLQQVRDTWPEVLEAVKSAKMNAWLVLYTAQVRELRDGEMLVLSFPSQKDVDSLKQTAAPGQGVGDYLKQAVNALLGFTPKLIARVDASTEARGTEARGTEARGTGGSVPADPSSAPDADVSASVAQAPAATKPAATQAATNPAATTQAATTQAATNPAATKPASSGWTTVAIPGSGTADSGAAVSGAAAPAGTEAEARPAATSASSAARGNQTPPPAAFADEPPFDEEPPPFEDEVPHDFGPEASAVPSPTPGIAAAPTTTDATTTADGWATTAPPREDDTPARATPAASVAPQAPPTQAPVQQTTAPQTTAQQTTAQQPPASPQSSPRLRPQGKAPAFGEKQRYGESVVREILGATFLEEQPHDPATRPRGA